jgi:PIN domain nuclease of toxin-antitoxin system
LRLLLDTHIWLWSILDPPKLGRRVQHEFQADGSELWLSPISVWEATVLHRKGRLRIPGNLDSWLQHATGRFREATLTHEVVLATTSLALDRFDPADLFLAATAKVFGLTLVTADRKLLGLGDIATLANR